MRPVGERLLVKLVDEPREVAGITVVKQDAKDAPVKAEIVAVGSGRVTDMGEEIALDFDRGQVILYSPYGGIEVEHLRDAKYAIVNVRDVLAIVSDRVDEPEEPKS